MYSKIIKQLEIFISTKDITKASINTTAWVRPERLGLCAHFDLYEVPERFSIFKSWEHFSGERVYPVPPTEDMVLVDEPPNEEVSSYKERPAEAAYDFYELYVGEQLEMRLSLAKHILKCLVEEQHKYDVTHPALCDK